MSTYNRQRRHRPPTRPAPGCTELGGTKVGVGHSWGARRIPAVDLASVAFRIYLHFFNSYSATYGSVGAVITLMLWLYLTGAAILIGGELNSEIKHAEINQAAQRDRQKKRDREYQNLLQGITQPSKTYD